MKKKLRSILFLLLLMLLIAAVLFVQDYYHAGDLSEQALQSDEQVQVIKTDYGWFFDGPSEENGYVFYGGAKVEEKAYSPLLHSLAEAGLDVFLVKMPARIASLGTNKAAAIMKEYDYERWYVGGHSLGGATAALYASSHGQGLSGMILLAAYPLKDVDDSLSSLLVYGSEDQVLNRSRYEKGKELLSPNVTEHVIEGGNHAQFGDYGPQKGDGEALISAEEQVEETVQVIKEWIKEQ